MRQEGNQNWKCVLLFLSLITINKSNIYVQKMNIFFLSTGQSMLHLNMHGQFKPLLHHGLNNAWPNFDYKIRRDNEKNSYERHVYESVK